jgi:hypothetical protein
MFSFIIITMFLGYPTPAITKVNIANIVFGIPSIAIWGYFATSLERKDDYTK